MRNITELLLNIFSQGLPVRYSPPTVSAPVSVELHQPQAGAPVYVVLQVLLEQIEHVVILVQGDVLPDVDLSVIRLDCDLLSLPVVSRTLPTFSKTSLRLILSLGLIFICFWFVYRRRRRNLLMFFSLCEVIRDYNNVLCHFLNLELGFKLGS